MAEERETKEEQAQEKKKEAAPKSKNSMIVLGIIIGVIVVQGIMLFVFFQLTRPPNPKQIEEKAKQDSIKVVSQEQTTMGDVLDPPIEAIVNISGTDGSRFLKVMVVLEFDGKKYKKLLEELTKRHAKLKDLLIEYLSTVTLKQMEDPDSKNQIRNEYMIRVNASLPKNVGQISNVYFNEFIIQ